MSDDVVRDRALATLRRTERAVKLLLDANDRRMPWPQRCNGCGGMSEHVLTCPVLDTLIAPLAKLMDDLDAGCGDAPGTWRKQQVTHHKGVRITNELRFRYIVRTIYSVEQIPELTT